jgi:DNA oxidative demethylase
MLQLDLIPRQKTVLASGAMHLPDFIPIDEQVALLLNLREWTKGGWFTPSMLDGTPMNHPIACLGYQWRPYEYFEPRVGVPGDLINLSILSLLEAKMAEYLPYSPQTAIVNYFPPDTSLGMHQDRSEDAYLIQQGRPIVTFSLGDTAVFRLGNREHKGMPWQDVEMRSGDALVMGGYSRSAYHGVMDILPGTAPPALQMQPGRISVTMREVRHA